MKTEEKKRIVSSFTISLKTTKEFNDLCKKNHYNKSRIIEELIEKFIKDKK